MLSIKTNQLEEDIRQWSGKWIEQTKKHERYDSITVLAPNHPDNRMNEIEPPVFNREKDGNLKLRLNNMAAIFYKNYLGYNFDCSIRARHVLQNQYPELWLEANPYIKINCYWWSIYSSLVTGTNELFRSAAPEEKKICIDKMDKLYAARDIFAPSLTYHLTLFYLLLRQEGFSDKELTQ